MRDTILEHLEDLHQFYGKNLGVRLARKHLNWYCKNIDGAETLRKRVLRVEQAREQKKLVEDFFQTQV